MSGFSPVQPEWYIEKAIQLVERVAIKPLADSDHFEPPAPDSWAWDRAFFRRRDMLAQVTEALKAEGAHVENMGAGGPVMCFAGVAAHSSANIEEAIRNWKAAAEKQLSQARTERP